MATTPVRLVVSAHEGPARAYWVAGARDDARRERDLAREVLATVPDPEDRQVVDDDLAGIPP